MSAYDIDLLIDESNKVGMLKLLRRIEREMMIKVITDCNGKFAKAARVLNVNRTTLLEKRRSHGLPLLEVYVDE